MGIFIKKKLVIISFIALAFAFIIGLYYAFLDAWLLIPIGIAETFFLFVYNLESFGGRFHNNTIFVISWGILPVFAGTVIQINTINLETLAMAGIACVLSYTLIKTSRTYKELKQKNAPLHQIYKKELVLKLVSIGVIFGTILFILIKQF